MDIVIGFRQRYLEEYEKQEKNKLFLKYRKEVENRNFAISQEKYAFFLKNSHFFQVDVDLDTISSKIEQEFLKERSGSGSGGVKVIK